MSIPPVTPGLAVSLSASFLGFYTHAGFLQGLAEAGVWPAHLAGCSAGAIVAGLAATGNAPDEIFRFLKGTEFRWGFFEAGAFWRSFTSRIRGKGNSGLLSGRKAVQILRRRFGDRRIEDLHSPTVALAVTNLTRLRSEIRTHGPLAETIIASCAFPTIFSVQHLDGDAYWDGGIANGHPVDHWLGDETVRRVLVHSIQPPAALADPASSVAAACDRGFETASREIFALRTAPLRARGVAVEMLTTSVKRPGLFVTDRAADRCHAAGLESGRKAAALVLAGADTP